MNISVVIPAYNVEDTIEQTLSGLLRQTRTADEIIIVDNNSEDGTTKKIKEFIENNKSLKIILDKEDKKGPSPVRNKGASLSKSEVVAFLDADCIPPSSWIKIIEEELSRGADVVGGPYMEYNTKTFLKKYLDVMEKATMGEREVLGPDAHNDKFVLAGNLAIKKDLFFQVGKFDEAMETGEDIDLSKRIYKSGKSIVYNPEMATIHNHREAFRDRFKKAFGYGVLQARFLRKYFNREFNIVLSNRKTINFKFPFKIRLYPFSILYVLILSLILSFFNNYLTILLLILLFLSVNLRVFSLIIKSGRKINPFLYILFLFYWSTERLIFDIGKIYGSIKYKVICI